MPKVPEQLLRRLATEAEERGTSPEDLLQELLEAALDLHEMDLDDVGDSGVTP